MNAIDIYLEKRNTRLYVGRLQKEKRKFVFQYDKSYLRKDNSIALGPDLPLKKEKKSSLTLFPSFEDRIPSKNNPAYKEYCASVGISPSETNPFVLLAKLGQKGPSSFICVPVEKKQLLSSQDLKLFRKHLKLSIRDFADLFEVSASTVYRIENNKTTGKDSLKKIEIYYKSPKVALNQIKKTGNRINEAKRIFVEDFFKPNIIKQIPQGPFTVTAKDIKQCNEKQIVELIKRLSLMECYISGIPQNSVDFSSNTSAKDGGQDGLVSWFQSQAVYTNYFPSRYNCFQIKASSLSPQECKKEILDKEQKLKPALQEVIKKRGAYILCSTHLVSGVHLAEREEAVCEGIKTAGYDPDLIQIKFYSADKIANWLNTFPSLAVWFLKEVCGKNKYTWLSWEEWSLEDSDYRSEFRFHEELKEKRDRISNILSERRKIVHLAGVSGVGKTRLALEVFRPFKEQFSLFESNKLLTGKSSLEKGYNKDNKAGIKSDLQSEELIDKKNTVNLSHLVLYSFSEHLKTTHLRELKKNRCILVIDNCSLEQAEQFHKIALQEDSSLSLLTIGNEETEQGLQSIMPSYKKNIFKLEPDKEITAKMLAGSQDIRNKYIPPEYHILTEGLPFMVKLFQKMGYVDLLKDDIPTLRKKMLWGRETPDKDGEKVIKICSLFDTIARAGKEDWIFSSFNPRTKEEEKYLAEKMAKLDYDVFYKNIQFFKKKKIIQKHGDFMQVRPKPLSVWLAKEFIEETPPETIIKWLTEMKAIPEELSLEDKKQREEWIKTLSDKKKKDFNKWQENQSILHGLRESFCKQLSYLADDENAKNLVEKLCSETGIFGKKETLCTEWGYRCLYHLVELHPEVILKTLKRVFRDKSIEELKDMTVGFQSLFFENSILQDIVWILKKIARKKEFYREAVRLLLRLIKVDSLSTNHFQVKQVFINHFQLYLSGTEANPEEKFKIIEEIKASQSIKQQYIAIEALGTALQIGGLIGFDNNLMQTKKGQKLEHWQPKTNKEIQNYFKKSLELLIDFSTNQDIKQEIQKEAQSVLSSNLSNLLKHNLYTDVKKTIQVISNFTGSFRSLAKDNLLNFLEYNPEIKEDKKQEVREILKLLDPSDDLNERIHVYIMECPAYVLYKRMEEKKDEHYEKNFEKLVTDFVNFIENQKDVPEQTFKMLLHGEQRNTLSFAKEVAKKLKNPGKTGGDVLSLALKWKNDGDFNPDFLSGFILGFKEHDSNKVRDFLDHLVTDDKVCFLLDAYKCIILEDKDIERLITVIDKINLKPTDLRDLMSGRKSKSISFQMIKKLILILIGKEVDYSWDALQIYKCYVYQREPKDKKELLPVLYKLLTREGLLLKKYDSWNGYLYKSAVKDILDSKYKERFSKIFLFQIFNTKLSLFELAISFDEIKECCKEIARRLCPDFFLEESSLYINKPNIGILFKDEDSFSLELGKQISSVLSLLPEDSIKKWCQNNPDTVPLVLAKNIQLFSNGSLSSLCCLLLDEYGDQKKITKAISFNLGNFSWSGNVTDYFKKIKEALKELINHKHQNVCKFADQEISYLNKEIQRFEQKEQEQKELGFF